MVMNMKPRAVKHAAWKPKEDMSVQNLWLLCSLSYRYFHWQRSSLTHLNLWSGGHGLLVSGDNADVEQSRKDEDQTGSSSCPWTQRGHTINHCTVKHSLPDRKLLAALNKTIKWTVCSLLKLQCSVYCVLTILFQLNKWRAKLFSNTPLLKINVNKLLIGVAV